MTAKLTFLACAAATSLAAQQPAAAPEHRAMKPSPAFTELTSLVGEWEGQTTDGKTVLLTYHLASGGTALVERMQMGTEPEMVTVYHPDGNRLMVTHYCSAGNQPQMRTTAITGPVRQFSFDFVRATNLATPATGHMHHLTVTLVDRNHLTQEWTWQENGKSRAELFKYMRRV